MSLCSGADLENRDIKNMSAFLITCKHGSIEVLRKLIQAGARLDAVDKDEKNCVMIAAENNKVQMLKVNGL